MKHNNKTLYDSSSGGAIDIEMGPDTDGTWDIDDVESYFFTDEKIIERIVNGTLNTVPLGDLIV